MKKKHLKFAELEIKSFATQLEKFDKKTIEGGTTPACVLSLITVTIGSGYVFSEADCPTDAPNNLLPFGNSEVPKRCRSFNPQDCPSIIAGDCDSMNICEI